MFGSGVAVVAIAAVAAALGVAATQMYGMLDAHSVQALYALGMWCGIVSFWCLAPLALAAGLAAMRSHAMPEWYGYLGLVCCFAFVLTGLSFATHGFFSPAGAMPWVGFVCFLAWMCASSWLCMQKHPVHARAMSPAMSH